jgi:CRP-like cAMP-binding protein
MSNSIKFKVIKNAGDAESYAAGDAIFKKGDAGDSMFVVVTGEVDIIAEGKVVDHLTEGDLFGEMSLIDKQARSADAIASTDCSVVRIDEKRFLFMTDHTPRFALQVMRLIAARLRERLADLEKLRSE